MQPDLYEETANDLALLLREIATEGCAFNRWRDIEEALARYHAVRAQP